MVCKSLAPKFSARIGSAHGIMWRCTALFILVLASSPLIAQVTGFDAPGPYDLEHQLQPTPGAETPEPFGELGATLIARDYLTTHWELRGNYNLDDYSTSTTKSRLFYKVLFVPTKPSVSGTILVVVERVSGTVMGVKVAPPDTK